MLTFCPLQLLVEFVFLFLRVICRSKIGCDPLRVHGQQDVALKFAFVLD